MLARLSSWKKVAWETLSCWDSHDAMTHNAALAFYTLFSLAPVLLMVRTAMPGARRVHTVEVPGPSV
jgi:uncharacterized BrkB/YihY/UPF0761 family membrane protein